MVGEDAASAKLYLLGHPRLELACGREVRIHSRKGMAMLALLAMSRRAERSRVWLQQMLWGSRPQKQAQSSLRRELASLRKVLEDAGLAILESDNRLIRLVRERVWLDIDHPDLLPSTGQDLLEGVDIVGEEQFEDWLRENRNRIPDLLDNRFPQPTADDRGTGHPPGFRSAVALFPAADMTGSAAGRQLAARVSHGLHDLLPRLRWLPIIPSAATPPSLQGDGQPPAERPDGTDARYLLQTEIYAGETGLAVNFTVLERPGQVIRWTETRELPAGGGEAAVDREVARAVNCIGEIFDLCEQRHGSGADPRADELSHLAWKIRFHINQFTQPDFDLAEQLMEVMLAQYPTQAETLMLRANLTLWQQWIARSDTAQSARIMPSIRAAMRADPADSRGQLFAGILETWQRRSAKAIQHLTHACALDPSSAQAHSHLGAAYYLSGDPGRALGPLEHALFLAPLDPKRFHTIGQLAVVLWMLDRHEEALDKALEILLTHPGYALAHMIEAAALTALGRSAEADEARRRISGRNVSKYHAVLDWMPFTDESWKARLRAALFQPPPAMGATPLVAVG